MNKVYWWEIETVDGAVLRQFGDDGKENTWKSLDPDKVVRVSFTPIVKTLPRHDFLIPIDKGVKFIRRFGRAFLKQADGFNMSEYANCIVTNKYRAYVFHSSGQVLVTDKNHEVYI